MKKPSENAGVRVTMSDVARRSGVHASTVSAVLSGKTKERRISSDIAARVRRAAAELDFTPNLVSRSLRTGATHTLSFFNGYRSRDRGDLYMDALTTAIEQEAGERGYDLNIACNFRRTSDETYRYLNGGHSDGLIFFAPQADDPLLPYLQKSRLPVVLLGGGNDATDLPRVTSDQEAGMRQVAERLLALGHRRVAALTPAPDAVHGSEARLRVAALQAHLAAGSAHLWECHVDAPSRDPVPAYATFLRQLLSEPEPPTALFCWHDFVGYKALSACEIAGISVPGQLSVVGFDGLHWPSTSPHLLASVVVPLETMARASVSLLHDVIAGHERSDKTFPVGFQEGTTLAPPHR